MSLSTHVLDTANGRPAVAVDVTCEFRDGDTWQLLDQRTTDADGRIGGLVERDDMRAGTYRLTFATGAWARTQGRDSFWPEVAIVFEVTAPDEHYHVPLLLSPYGYSTYRGS